MRHRAQGLSYRQLSFSIPSSTIRAYISFTRGPVPASPIRTLPILPSSFFPPHCRHVLFFPQPVCYSAQVLQLLLPALLRGPIFLSPDRGLDGACLFSFFVPCPDFSPFPFSNQACSLFDLIAWCITIPIHLPQPCSNPEPDFFPPPFPSPNFLCLSSSFTDVNSRTSMFHHLHYHCCKIGY